MVARVFTALLVAMLIVVQPMFAQNGVIILDLGIATDEELVDALDAATELELIMRTEWELLAEDAREAEAPEEPSYHEPYYIEEPALAAEAEEPAYYAGEELAIAEAAEAEAEEIEEAEYVAEYAADEFLYNEFLLESQRLVRLAEEAYGYGDYEAAAAYAWQASHYAQLSDEYIAQRTGTAIAADANGYPLPAAFTVRPWAIYRDCLWNIAAMPEIFGNPHLWPELFNANRNRMPNPNNPDLVLPGMILDIPSIEGEVREGLWQSGRVYRR